MRVAVVALTLTLLAITRPASAAAPSDADRLASQAAELDRAGRSSEAVPLIDRALAMAEASSGPNAEATLGVTLDAARIHLRVGDFDQACALFTRGADGLTKAHGAEDVAVADVYSELAACFQRGGDVARAVAAAEHEVAILERTSPASARLADALRWLGVSYGDESDYVRARPTLERAVDMAMRASGERSMDTARALASLGRLHRHAGDVRGALELLARAFGIASELLGDASPETARIALDAGEIMEEMGQLDGALQTLETVRGVFEKNLPADDPDLLMVWLELANLHERKGDLDEARELYDRIAQARTVSKTSAWFISARIGLADVYRRQGEYAKALAYENEVVTLTHEAGLPGGDVVRMLVAVLRLATGDRAAAIADLTTAEDALEKLVRNALAVGSDEERAHYLAQFGADAHALPGMHLTFAPNDPAMTRLALLGVLRRKGLALDASMDTVRALRARMTPDTAKLLDRLVAARAELASASRARTDADEVARRRRTTELLEAQVAQASAAFRADAEPVTLERVQARIPEDAALVELIVYAPIDPKGITIDGGPRRYAAYVLRHTGGPAAVDLGAAAAIDARTKALRDALAKSDGDARPAARALDEAVMARVRPLLGDARRILLAPDGALALVPFGAMEDEHGAWLAERYGISYLASGRDLLRLGDAAPTTLGAPLVIAAPDFGQAPPRAEGEGAPRIVLSPLPGTEAEARGIAALASDAVVLTGDRATKDALAAVRRPRFLHLATHGVYLDDATARALAGDRGFVYQAGRGAPQPAAAVSPLVRSMLALAGANQKPEALMTALEASGLDLWGTKLVVLSACETGVGEALAGDGVYGLRRAFQMAGAESLVMSLWSVDDEATRALMVAYYKELARGGGRAESLRAAQRAVAEEPRWSHPHYWAAFIASGDWRTMDGRDVAPAAAPRAPIAARPPHACGCETLGAPAPAASAGALALLLGLLVARRRSAR